MAKGYWIATYRSVSDLEKLASYARVAVPVIEAHGGKILIRGMPVKTYEEGLSQRAVVIEFESVNKAIAAYESAEYQAAAAILKGFAERDIRIIEGL